MATEPTWAQKQTALRALGARLAAGRNAPVTQTTTPAPRVLSTPSPYVASTFNQPGGVNALGTHILTPAELAAQNANNPNDLSGLPPEFQALYGQLDKYLQELQKRGQVINPNIQITPDQLQQFTNQASAEIDPYYANLLKTSVSDFQYALGNSADVLKQNETQAQTAYNTGLRTLGESAAEKGFAQSGLRQRDEQTLATDTQNTLDANRRTLANSAGTAARTLAGTYGASAVPSFNLGPAPSVTAGQSGFSYGGGATPLYNLSDSVYAGLTGSNQYAQDVAKRNRASQLESAFRSNQALDQARALNF